MLSAFFMLSINAWCQQQLKGKVFDAETNSPLIGATIKTSDKKVTVTDNNGAFSINCSESLELSISYIGYTTQKQVIQNCNEEVTINLSIVKNELNEVEITATSTKEKMQLQQPKAIVKLDNTELKRGTGLYLDDAINANVPGVFMQRRTASAGQQFNIRGYGNGLGFKGANNNFDGQGSKVYLNGIAITDAEGITLMDDIDFGSIDKVEISKGPSGTLYGLAIAGVVNLQTQKAEKNKTSIGQDFMAGSYGLLRTTTRLSIGGEKSSLLINYGRQQFDGFMVHTKSHKDFVNLMGDFVLNEKQSITTYVGYSDSYDERNGELTDVQYDSLDYSGNTRYIDNNAHSAVKTFRAGVGHTYHFNKNIANTTSFFGSSQNMDNSSAGGWSDKAPLNYGLRSTFDMDFNLSDGIKLSSITGIELQKMNTIANSYSMIPDSTNLNGYNIIGSLRSIAATSSATASYFTQWTLGLPKNFSITAGVGISNMTLSLQDRLWANTNNHPGNTTPQEYRKTYSNLVSPTFSINKKISEVASIYGTYSVGYKAPVSSQFYIPTTGEVNEGLVPEKGTQIEVGTKGSFLENRLYYSIAVFNAKFEDKMTAVSVQNPQNTVTLYSYVANGGSLNNNGLEVLVKYELMKSNKGFIKSLSPFANFTFSDFKYENFQYQTKGKNSLNQDSLIVNDYSGNQVAGVPPIVFNVGLDIDTKIGIYGNINYNYRDAMYYTSDELNQTSSYGLVNAKLGFRKTIKHFGFDIYGGASNITGTQYYYMVFLNQLPDAYIPAPYEINYFGGVNLKYLF
ncbi:MAG: TonB-dependent receptor [Vicingus serpentipes]|nr:TonB-dependent receptor [Vicingus serpentipes]